MNNNIIEQFKLLIKQIQLDIDFSSGKKQMINMYRLRSIRNSLKVLQSIDFKIESSNQVKNMKGIGKGSLRRIDEILKTGKLSEINITEIDDKYLEYITNLEDVFGIGRKRAYDLFMKHGIKSINDLKKAYESGNIELPDNVIIGLKYLGQLKEKIPRNEIDEIKDFILNILFEIDPELFGIICGSYRRMLPESSDIDLIIVHPKAKTQKDTLKHNHITDFVKLLKKKEFITDSLTGEDVPTKYMGIFKWNNKFRRIDIRYMPYESYYTAILYFTGGKEFNRKMRHLALDMEYVLNEYGIYNEKGVMFKVKSEKDVFDILGMEYLIPEKRN